MNPAAQATSTITAADGTLLSLIRHGTADAKSAVVLAHGFIQNARAFSVPSRSLVDALVADGHAVYAINLRGRGLGDPATRVSHDLKDTVDNEGVAVVDAVAARHKHVGWVGHSMGGIIGATLPVDSARRLKALVTIGAPLTPGRAPLRRRAVVSALSTLGRTLGARGVPFDGRRYALGFLVGRRFMEHPLSTYAPVPLWKPGSLSDADLRHTLVTAFDTDSHHVLADLADMIGSQGARAGRLPVRERLQASLAPLLAIAGRDDALAPVDA
ncbi:MAG TPA: alpha/beta fold hydrolase, partial [Myxococcota bacterium]